MTVTNSTIRTEVWNEVYTFINADVSDPESRSAKWIFGAFPNPDDSFVGYPIIIIDPVKKSNVSNVKTMGSSGVYKKVIDVEITIYAVKSAQIDSLSDSIEAQAISNSSDLRAQGLNETQVTDGDTDTLLVGGDRVHVKPMNLRLERW